MLKCGLCEKESKAKIWNQKTFIWMKKNNVKTTLTPIQRGHKQDNFKYICPKCNQIVKAKHITKP